ncbi:MAG TPA: O-antigen ligase family protein [Candidatus Moranbacteria bacterium]|nr:O-antigen ligase family protein [Candidatus Moranbacteria bacterium]
METNQKSNKSSVAYAYLLIIAALSFSYILILGNIAENFKLILGVFLFLILLVISFYKAAGVFLGLIFFLPVLIGLDKYQTNVGSFFQAFFPIEDLYINPFSLACIFLVFLGGVEIWKRGLKIIKVPLFFILSIVVLISLVSFFQSDFKIYGIAFELYFISGFAAYFLGYLFLGTKNGYLKTIFTIILSSIIPATVGIIQLATGSYFFEADSTLGRISGTLPHSNTFGSFLFVVLTVAMFAFFGTNIKKMRSSHIVLARILPFLILVPLLISTYSRTAWVGFAVSLAILAMMKPIFRPFIAYFGALAISLMFIIEKTRERILGVFDRYMFDSLYGRFDIWGMAIFEARKKIMTGYGIGSFEEVIRNVQGKETGNVYPHNDAIRFLLEGGILGLFGFFLYMSGALFYAAKSFLHYPKKIEKLVFGKYDLEVDFRFLGAIPLALFGIMVLISMVEAPSMDFIYQIFAWTMLGSWLGMSQEYIKKPN